MKYPIDVEKYIAAMRIEFGANEVVEEAHSVIIPLVNAAYRDGVDGKLGYPLSPPAELAAFEAYKGKPAIALKLITTACKWCNIAYEQGRAAAEKEATE